jgi:protein-S-isoprenylcysteine O-methyltransferase Ste14
MMNLLTIIQITIFVLGTLFIIFVSRKLLLSFKVHGFYRFFVFEFTLVLLLLNFPYWFNDPLSLQQIVSWILLIYSGLLLIQSVYFFKRYGGSKRTRENKGNLEFENTTSLIQAGIYKYIRHPMYGSLLFLGLGAMFKHINIISVLLAVLITIFVILTAKVEEKENINFFGSDYEGYMKNTKLFIPYIY